MKSRESQCLEVLLFPKGLCVEGFFSSLALLESSDVTRRGLVERSDNNLRPAERRSETLRSPLCTPLHFPATAWTRGSCLGTEQMPPHFKSFTDSVILFILLAKDPKDDVNCFPLRSDCSRRHPWALILIVIYAFSEAVFENHTLSPTSFQVQHTPCLVVPMPWQKQKAMAWLCRLLMGPHKQIWGTYTRESLRKILKFLFSKMLK